MNELIGIHFDYPEDKYRSAPGISQSELKEVGISLAHYRALTTGPKSEPTEAQKIGTLVHSLILCGKQDFVVIPDDAPKQPTKAQLNAKKPSDETIAAIKYWSDFQAANPEMQLLDDEQGEHILKMRDAVMAHPIAKAILSRPGNNEVACWKQDEETGLLMRGRADRVTTDDNNLMVIPDLKTTGYGGAARKSFEKSILDWGYHIQGAYYLDLFGATHFVFIVVEKEPPYAVAVYSLKPEAVQLGRQTYKSYLRQVAEAERSGHWPAYSLEMEQIGVPEWATRNL